MSFPMVTVFKNKITYWSDRSLAIKHFESIAEEADRLGQYDLLDGVENVMSCIENNASICTDVVYDAFTMLKANAALVTGRVL